MNKELERLIGKFDDVDNLKVKKYGNTVYIYEDKEEL